MKRRLLLWILIATAALEIVAVAAMPPQQVEAQVPQTKSYTVSVNTTIPIRGDTVSGTLTLVLSGVPDNLDIDWSFEGMVNGQVAQAAGTATASWTGHGYLSTLTGIDVWNTPIPQPRVPKSVVVFSISRVTFVAGFPFLTDVALPAPFDDPSSLVLAPIWDVPAHLLPMGLPWPSWRMPLDLFRFGSIPTGGGPITHLERTSTEEPLPGGYITTALPGDTAFAFNYNIVLSGAIMNADYEVYVNLDGTGWQRQPAQQPGYFSLLVTSPSGAGNFKGAISRSQLPPGPHTVQFALHLAGYARYISAPLTVEVRQ